MRAWRFLRHHGTIVAYLLVVAAFAWSTQAILSEQRTRDHKIEAEAKARERSIQRTQETASKERVEQICRAVNANGDALRKLVNRTGSSKAPAGSSPELVRAYEQSAREAEAFKHDANQILDGARCVPEEILKTKEAP